MAGHCISVASPLAVIYGLDDSLASQLHAALRGQAMPVLTRVASRQTDLVQALANGGLGLVFCADDRNCYLPLLHWLREHRTGVPVVVVSRLPDFDAWLDAMEAGAADYCAAPFEPAEVTWILESALRPQPVPVA